jgi:hypothetical protein
MDLKSYRFALPSNEDIQNAVGEVKSMDKDIEAIIAREAGIAGLMTRTRRMISLNQKNSRAMPTPKQMSVKR